MLELDDIQHFLLTRPRASAARYGFLRFRQADQGRAWLAGIVDRVGRGRAVDSGGPVDSRWVTVAFTWSGLRALGVDDASLSTFPEEFRQGMAARAAILGDTGANHPDHWIGGLASPDLHAIVILLARDVAERERRVLESRQHRSIAHSFDADSTRVGPRAEGVASARRRSCPRICRASLEHQHDLCGGFNTQDYGVAKSRGAGLGWL